MQKGSLSHLSVISKLLVLVGLTILSTIIFSVISLTFGMALYSLSASELTGLMSGSVDGSQMAFLKFFQGFSSIGTFLVPAWVGAYLFSDHPGELMSSDRLPYRLPLLLILVSLLALSGNIISDLCYQLTMAFEFPDSWLSFKQALDESQESMNLIYDRFLTMNSFTDFLSIFLIMAILPAVCEEILFRGLLQPLFQRSVGVHGGIFLTAFIFGIIHQQFYAFLSIFVLGLILGYVRYWSNSVWVSTWMHLVNNGTIVIAVYFFGVSYSESNNAEESMEVWQYVAGSLAFFVLLFVSYRVLSANKTPEFVEEDYTSNSDDNILDDRY